jgi:hypothetical protein
MAFLYLLEIANFIVLYLRCKMQDSMNNAKTLSIIPMPIKGRPYKHQIRAFNFICSLFGLLKGGGVPAISGWGAALLMEMG